MLEDISESASKIQRFTKDLSFDDFLKDEKTIDAVVRNFEVIGEASNRLPAEFKDNNRSIDWIRMKGFRNRIVHDYFGIDHSIVWNIIQNYLPDLIREIDLIRKVTKK